MSKIPKGYKLSHGYDRKLIESKKYQHITVADLIEILEFYPQDANVWIDKNAKHIRPIESTHGSNSNVFLG